MGSFEIPMKTPVNQIYAIKYGHIPERRAAENFIHGDAHDRPMPIDFFVWAIVGAEHTYVVDTGFDPVVAAKRNRQLLRSPAAGLQTLGIDAHEVRDVILTHLHPTIHSGNDEMSSASALSRPGKGDDLLHRPVHVPCLSAGGLRGER